MTADEFSDTIRPYVPVVLSYVLTSIAFLLLIVRCFVRLCIIKRWGWDDISVFVSWVGTSLALAIALTLVSQICVVFNSVILQINQKNGGGKHVWVLTPDNLVDLGKWIVPYEICFLMASFLTKVSICFFILRIKDTRRTKQTLTIMMIILGLATLPCLVLSVTICIPLHRLWNKDIQGRCLDFNWLFISTVVQSAISVFADLVLVTSPIFIVWNVRISLRCKVLICGLMSLGLMATVVTALKCVYLNGYHSTDFAYDTFAVSICTVLESTLGVIAACIPACWPILNWPRSRSCLRPNSRHESRAFSEVEGMLDMVIESTEKVEEQGGSRPLISVQIPWDPPTPVRHSQLLMPEMYSLDKDLIGIAI